MDDWGPIDNGQPPEFTPERLISTTADARLEVFGTAGFFLGFLILFAGSWFPLPIALPAIGLCFASVLALEFLQHRVSRRLGSANVHWFRRGIFKAVVRHHLMRPSVVKYAYQVLREGSP